MDERQTEGAAGSSPGGLLGRKQLSAEEIYCAHAPLLRRIAGGTHRLPPLATVRTMFCDADPPPRNAPVPRLRQRRGGGAPPPPPAGPPPLGVVTPPPPPLHAL
jgi:hypothetical protein